MVTTDDTGEDTPIKELIARGIEEGERGEFDRDADLAALMDRIVQTRGRLAARLDGLPDDATLRAHLEPLSGELLHTLLVSEPWDTTNVGGEEVDVEWLLEPPRPPRPEPAAARAEPTVPGPARLEASLADQTRVAGRASPA
jgi:hypothetical protein